MANFSGQNIHQSYTNILNIGSGPGNCTLPSAPNRCQITDSAGTASSLFIGAAGAGIKSCGPVISTGNLTAANGTFSGSLGGGATTLTTLTVSNDTTLNGTAAMACDVTVGGNLTVAGTKLQVTSSCTKTANNTCIGGNLNVTGGITAGADVIAYSTSDKKFKSNLNKICNTKDIVNGLNGYSFEWNEESGREGKDLGLIAQDVKEVLPEIVHTRDNGSLAVDYPKIIPVLVEEVKRLSKEIEELKKA